MIRLDHKDVLLLDLIRKVLRLHKLQHAPRPVHHDEASVALGAVAVAELLDEDGRDLVH